MREIIASIRFARDKRLWFALTTRFTGAGRVLLRLLNGAMSAVVGRALLLPMASVAGDTTQQLVCRYFAAVT